MQFDIDFVWINRWRAVIIIRIRKDKAQSKLEKKETGDQEKFPAVEKESLHIPELPGDVIEALATRDL